MEKIIIDKKKSGHFVPIMLVNFACGNRKLLWLLEHHSKKLKPNYFKKQCSSS